MVFLNKNKDILERLIHIEGKIDRIEKRIRSNCDEEMMYLKSYSQNGEDVLICHLFQRLNINKPTYIDIGAHHPYRISNTALLHELGSKGINIEANPNLFDAFLEERPNDINICCGIGKEKGIMPFYMIDKWSGRNSFIRDNVETFVKGNPNFYIQEIRNIEIKTLDDIVLEYNLCIEEEGIADYMSIDIEGLEYEVLSVFDMKKKGPKVLTLEIMKNDIERENQLNKILEEADYDLWFRSGTNYTYIKNKYRFL